MAQEAIFIGYRRDDSADVAGRIYDQLESKFGEGRLFKDVDSIPPGEHFQSYIARIISQCRIFLAVIGPGWIGAVDDRGSKRLDDPSDFVRVEIETALESPSVRVIPLLVGGAQLPRASELPESLRPLLDLHAANVRRDPDFRTDMARLIRDLEARLGLATQVPQAEAPTSQTTASAPSPPIEVGPTWPKLGDEDYGELRKHSYSDMIVTMLTVIGATGASTTSLSPILQGIIYSLALLWGGLWLFERPRQVLGWNADGVSLRSPWVRRYEPWEKLKGVDTFGGSLRFDSKDGPLSYAYFKDHGEFEKYAKERLAENKAARS